MISGPAKADPAEEALARACREELIGRAGHDWELYRKWGQSSEVIATPTRRGEVTRREEGWAARWWQEGAPRFACGCDAAALRRAIAQAALARVLPSPPPRWPLGRSIHGRTDTALDPPPEVWEDLARQLSAESRGEGLLTHLTVRRGRATERIENGAGLDVSQSYQWTDGIAAAVGRRAARACEARLVFRWEEKPDLASVARRLADRAILPLFGEGSPFPRGEWLLDPSVAAAVLAGIAPLFTAERPPRWLNRARFAAPAVTILDDATADAGFDGEGTATSRLLLVEKGELVGRLLDLSTASANAGRSTGHGVRASYRVPPAAGPRRLFFETDSGARPLDLLSSVRRGLFASALTAPPRIDLNADAFDIEFTGIAVVAGRAQRPVASARARGRLSQLLRRVASVATDRQFFPAPFLTGAPTVLIERADFE
jgi:predicted Zn-dependent protease